MTSAAKRYLQAFVVALFLVLIAAAPAFGHADLLSTSPADGETLSVAPGVLELVFTEGIDLVGDGVRLTTSDGTLVAATVELPDVERIALTPAVTLANGAYILAWTVASGDGHVIDGSASFDVAVPASVVVAPDEDPVDVPSDEVASDPVDISPTTLTAAPTIEPPAQDETAISLAAMDLDGDSGSLMGEWMALVGRWAAMVCALVAIGAFAFSWTAFSGSEREIRGVVRWIGAAGVFIVAGALLEAIGASMVLASTSGGGLSIDAMSETLTGSYRWAIALRISGGALLMWGVVPVATPFGSLGTSVPPEVSGSGDGGTKVAVAVDPPTATYRLDVRGSIAGLVGVGIVAVSYLFDGHTVVASPTIVARSADLLHVVGGGVWFGGLVIMAWLFASRMKRGVPADAARVAVRFSRVAAAALATVGLAGGALAWTILDSPSELVSTSWGRLLLVKTFLVAVVAGIGTYNHYRVVPALDSEATDGIVVRRLTRLVTVEGGILVVVLIVTAALVAVAS